MKNDAPAPGFVSGALRVLRVGIPRVDGDKIKGCGSQLTVTGILSIPLLTLTAEFVQGYKSQILRNLSTLKSMWVSLRQYEEAWV